MKAQQWLITGLLACIVPLASRGVFIAHPAEPTVHLVLSQLALIAGDRTSFAASVS
jgi:hypothetical protein